jgi:NitT/TauT family transport system substrate-binding protein
MRRWPPLLIALLLIVVVFFLLQTAQPPPKSQLSLRVGLLPVVDALPFVVAENEKLFEKEGLSVELVYFGSARDRDSAILSGQVDLGIHDPVGALMLIGNGVPIKIVGFLCCLSDEDSNVGFYYVKAPGARQIKTVAISRNTIIEYVASKLVKGDVEFVDVPSIANRYQLLLEGRVDAAVLPDPWGTMALRNNATLIAKYRDLVVIVASRSLLETQEGREALRRLISALNKAVDMYNANPEKYRDLLMEKLRIPTELRQTYQIVWNAKIVEMPRDVFNDAVSWLLQKGLIKQPLKYEDCVS